MHRFCRSIFAMGHCKADSLHTSNFAEFPLKAFATALFTFRLCCSSQSPTSAELWNWTVVGKPEHMATDSLALTTARTHLSSRPAGPSATKCSSAAAFKGAGGLAESFSVPSQMPDARLLEMGSEPPSTTTSVPEARQRRSQLLPLMARTSRANRRV